MTNLRVFDFRQWWRMNHHDNDQMELMGHIVFSPIQGYTHLFVAKVSEEDEVMLKLLGIPRDHSVLTEGTVHTEHTTRILHRFGDQYSIMETYEIPFSKEK